jgi:hypothetical protein
MRFEHGITSRCTISCYVMLSRLNIAMCMMFEHITPSTPVYTETHIHITREITGRNREISTGIERCMKQEEQESRLIPHKYYWGKTKPNLSPVTKKCHKTYHKLAFRHMIRDRECISNIPAPSVININALIVLVTGPFCIYGLNINSCAINSMSPV